MAHPTASVQLIVFGARLQSDIAGVLRDVAEAGFPAFEAGNLFATYGEGTTRQLLEENKLTVSGAHFGYDDYADADKLDAHIAYAKAIGLHNLMCSGVSDSKTIAGYQQSAKLFNEIGKKLADQGLTFNYHNHAWEFDDLGGGTNGMQVLAHETDPTLVKFNLDVFWLYYGGQDPAAFISRYADRTGYFHFKDGRRTTNTEGKARPEFLELGTGNVDLKAAYAAAEAAGAQWIVVEQDSTKLLPADSAAISRKYLRDALGV